MISLAKQDLDGTGPIGLLPLLGGTVLDLQIAAAEQAGCKKFVFLCPVTHGALLQKIDQLQQRGFDAEYVRNPSDLVQYASDEHSFIYIADGILPDAAITEKLALTEQEILFTVVHADEYQEFERIDINQRWLGILTLKASRLTGLIDVPNDWDIGSALLRTAVQTECPREIISDKKMGSGSIVHLQSEVSTGQYTRNRLKSAKIGSGNFLDRMVLQPLVKGLLPRLWKLPKASRYLGLFGVGSGVAAMVAAGFSYPVTALIILLVGGIVLFAHEALRKFFRDPVGRDWTALIFDLFVVGTILLLLLSASTSAVLVPNLVVLILLIVQTLLAGTRQSNARISLIKPNIRLVLLVLLAGAIPGHFSLGFYLAALITGLFLLLDNFLPSHSSKISSNSAE